MTSFKIMQEPGAAATARRARWGALGLPPMRRVGAQEAPSEADALDLYVTGLYVTSGTSNSQYRGHRLEWRGPGRTWRPDDGERKQGRSWRAVVTLANGAYVHDIYLHAWRTDGRA